jgi:GNAT superfamily N-acetyltransferase
MRLQAETLFALDEQGRIVAVNAPRRERRPGPRVFLGRTREANVWHLRYDLPAALAEELSEMLAVEPAADAFDAEPGCLAALRAVLARDAPVEREYRGPAYVVPPNAAATTDVPLIEVEGGNVGLLRGGFEEWVDTAAECTPFVAAVEAGRAVSICCCARKGADAAEAGVETLPTHRGRGLASAVAAAWALAVRRRGLLPLYSTSWENLASQAVAGRLGARFYGEDVWLA